MTFQRVWQAVLSVLTLSCFFALEYMRGMSVPSLALVICSWVTVVAPVLLAISWVVKRQYVRTLVLAALVVATRMSLEDTLSEFLLTAAWFLTGAIVLVLIIALVLRWWRKGKAQEPAVVPQESESATAAPPVAPPAEESVVTAHEPEVEEAPSCGSCGADLPSDGASFCRKCGAQLA